MSLIKKIHPSLPVFSISYKDRYIIYVPGYLSIVTPGELEILKDFFSCKEISCNKKIKKLSHYIKNYSENLIKNWEKKKERPFKPVCLTVYLSNHCNLSCSYCYVYRLPGKKSPVITPELLLEPCRFVSGNCRNRGVPFHLVLHGGGEPSMHWNTLRSIYDLSLSVSKEYELPWTGSIITNGVLSEKKARWIAGNFNMISLSCDGPPYIQNKQRFFHNGNPTSHYIERTVKIFLEENAKFNIRVTITPYSMKMQEDIISYCIDVLKARSVSFEPLYKVHGAEGETFKEEDGYDFVEHFLNAQKKASSSGVTLSFSGVRPDELHGPYCSVLRDVFHILPDGSATSCFFCTDKDQKGFSCMITGDRDGIKGKFDIDEEKVMEHCHKALNIPELCRDCLNIYHCSRDCPGTCNIREDISKKGFSCIVKTELAMNWIIQAVESGEL